MKRLTLIALCSFLITPALFPCGPRKELNFIDILEANSQGFEKHLLNPYLKSFIDSKLRHILLESQEKLPSCSVTQSLKNLSLLLKNAFDFSRPSKRKEFDQLEYSFLKFFQETHDKLFSSKLKTQKSSAVLKGKNLELYEAARSSSSTREQRQNFYRTVF